MLIGKKVFAKAGLNKESEMFVIYIVSLEFLLAKIAIYLLRTTQITGGNSV